MNLTLKKEPAFFLIAIVIFVSIVYYFNTRNIELKIALFGYGPQEYVSQKLFPEFFEKDYMADGINIYDFSLPMRIFHFAAKYFGVSPNDLMYPFIFGHTFLFALSVFLLSMTLFNDRYVSFLITAIFFVNSIGAIDLGRFGLLFDWPLYYVYGSSFQLLAFAFFLKNNFLRSFAFLGLATWSHVTIGIFGLFFILFATVFNLKSMNRRRFTAGLLMFVMLVFPLFFEIVLTARLSSGGLPQEQWIKFTRIFSYHWYPITMKLFSYNAHREFFPILFICFFFFVSLRYFRYEEEKIRKILLGCAGCLLLVLFGLFFSDIFPVPFIIRLCPQRSSGIITFFGICFIVNYLIRKLYTRKLLLIFLAVYSLGVLFFKNPGLGCWSLLLLIFDDIREKTVGNIQINHPKIMAAGYSLILILLGMGYYHGIYNGSIEIPGGGIRELFLCFKYLDFASTNYLMITMFAAISMRIAASEKSRFVGLFPGIVIGIVLFSTTYIAYKDAEKWYSANGAVAKDYLDIQKWANKNTVSTALFINDPTHYYGWRDFSQRSSFGNIRYWGYGNLIAYNSSLEKFREGVRRLNEFGIDIDGIRDKDIREWKGYIYADKFDIAAKKKYYCSSDDWRLNLASKYKIDYFVMKKKEMVQVPKLRRVYSNSNYIVYEARVEHTS